MSKNAVATETTELIVSDELFINRFLGFYFQASRIVEVRSLSTDFPEVPAISSKAA